MDLATARLKTAWLPDAFFDRFVGVAEELGADAVQLGTIVHMESGFRAHARNAKSNASGLIQWMPENVPHGMTPEQLRGLSELAQLEFVRDWFAARRQMIGGRRWDPPGLLYLTVFAPGRLSPTANGSTVAYAAPSSNYTWNQVLDTDGDGKIDVDDLTAKMQQIAESAAYAPFRARIEAAGGGSPSSPSSFGRGALIASLMLGAGYVAYRLVLRG